MVVVKLARCDETRGFGPFLLRRILNGSN
ncbi:hypothetical protein [Escherichia phage BI-EHEC]|nr:hypothetical protein [Escherichia phage BI-EHEC]